jgi:hypothetical protein
MELRRPLSDEYWRPPAGDGDAQNKPDFSPQGNDAFCGICGAPYAAGAVFCHLCGVSREHNLQATEPSLLNRWLALTSMRAQFGFSTASLACILGAVIFLLAALMTGFVYNTSTLAEWQAVQCLRIEWLLATLVALMSAMLFRTKL